MTYASQLSGKDGEKKTDWSRENEEMAKDVDDIRLALIKQWRHKCTPASDSDITAAAVALYNGRAHAILMGEIRHAIICAGSRG